MADTPRSEAGSAAQKPASSSQASTMGGIWMGQGVLKSTAKTRGQSSSPTGGHSAKDANQLRAGPESSSRSSSSHHSNNSSQDSPLSKLTAEFRPVTNQRGYRFGRANSDEDSRPAQRLQHLKSGEQEECGDVNELAISQGRRIYLGNLLYTVKPAEIETLVKEHGCEKGYSTIHISIDPFTGRNPSYCFLEFESAAAANKALDTLNGKTLRGRPVKSRPCQPKGNTLAGRRKNGNDGAFYRWGNYSGKGRDDYKSSRPDPSATEDGTAGELLGIQGPYETLAYHRQSSSNVERRLFVGNLSRMHDQAMAHDEMCKLFEGFEIVVASKRFSPREGNEGDNRRNWQLVDFVSRDEAAAALKATKDKTWRGARIRLEWAKR